LLELGVGVLLGELVRDRARRLFWTVAKKVWMTAWVRSMRSSNSSK
jgi:hypothetical protein